MNASLTANDIDYHYVLWQLLGLAPLRSQAPGVFIFESNSEPCPYEQIIRNVCLDFTCSFSPIFEKIPHLFSSPDI